MHLAWDFGLPLLPIFQNFNICFLNLNHWYDSANITWKWKRHGDKTTEHLTVQLKDKYQEDWHSTHLFIVTSCRGRIPALASSDAVNRGRPEQTKQPCRASSGAPEQSPVGDLLPAELHGPESLSLPESSHRAVGKSQPSHWYRKGGNPLA